MSEDTDLHLSATTQQQQLHHNKQPVSTVRSLFSTNRCAQFMATPIALSPSSQLHKRHAKSVGKRQTSPYPTDLPKEIAGQLSTKRRRMRMKTVRNSKDGKQKQHLQTDTFIDIPIHQSTRFPKVHTPEEKGEMVQKETTNNTNSTLNLLELQEVQIRDYRDFFGLPTKEIDYEVSDDRDLGDTNGREDEMESDNNGDTTITRKMFTPWTFGGPELKCKECNAIVWFQERSNKKHNQYNCKFSLCCQNGKIKLPLLQQTPPLLKKLMDPKGGLISTKFKDAIRRMNSMFAFTSMGGHIDHGINKGRGPYVFRINGQNHHRFGSLLPKRGEKPKFSQLYFYDTLHEVQNRMSTITQEADNPMENEIVSDLIKILDDINPLAKLFRMARDKYHQDDIEDLRIRLIVTPSITFDDTSHCQ